MTMKSIHVAALAVALAILTACSSTALPGSGSPSASPTPSAGPVTFHDRVGEMPKSRPDVATVTVAKQHGKISFAITFVNAPPLVTDQKSSGFWDLLVINIDAIGGTPATSTSYKILGGTPTVRGQPLTWAGVGSLPEHVNLYCDSEGACEGDHSTDIGPVTVTGSTLTVSVDPALLGNPTTLVFRVGVVRGTEPKLPEYSPNHSEDWAPDFDVDGWQWKVI
jgi:hypothetical protein